MRVISTRPLSRLAALERQQEPAPKPEPADDRPRLDRRPFFLEAYPGAEIPQLIGTPRDRVAQWCALPYPGHPRGCPNLGKEGCPPGAAYFADVIDLEGPVWFVGSAYDLAGHRAMMKARHPAWTERQCSNVYYWQPSVSARNRRLLLRFVLDHPGSVCFADNLGVNMTRTLREAGIWIDWHFPLARVVKGSFVAYPLPGCERAPGVGWVEQ